jgi:hypothetical protein
MQLEQSVLDRMQLRQLKCYGLLLRMQDSRRPKKIFHWTPYGRRKRGRSQQSWKNQMKGFMTSKNIEQDIAEGRRFWRLEMDRRLLAV